MKTLISLLIAIVLLLGTWLVAQRPPPGPPEFYNKTAAPTGSSTNQGDPMLRAFRQVMTNATSGAPAAAASAAPAAPTISPPVGPPAVSAQLPSVAPAGVAVPSVAPPPTLRQIPAAGAGAPGVPAGQISSGPAAPSPVAPAVGAVAAPSFPAPQFPAIPAPPVEAQPEAERIIPAGMIQINNMPLEQFFEIYSMVSGRTVLRPVALSGIQGVTLKAQSEMTVKEAIYAMDAVLALNQIAMIPVNSKFVKAVAAQMAASEGAAMSKLTPGNFSETEQFVTQIVQLKTVRPSELAQLLATFSKVANGITPFDNNQTIVLRDHASNVKRMLEVIEKVDVQVESDYRLEVIPIKYGKVADLYSTMGALISGSAGGGFSSSSAQPRRATGGLGTSSQLGQAGRGRMGSPLQPQQQQQPVAPGAAQNTFQNRLQQIVSRAAQGAEVELLQDARIVPDERSNTLLIFANKRDIKMITNIVAKVDVLLAQVLIEAVIMEVQLRDSGKIGVSMLQQPRQFGNTMSGAGGINNGQSFLNNITNLSSGLPSGFGYFPSLKFAGTDLDVAVAAIAENSTVNVVSRPRIQTSHAIPGTFVVADNLPFISGSYPNYGGYGLGGVGGGYGNQSIVERIDVGVTLSVTPFITPEGMVVMEIQQEANQKGGDVIIDGNPNPIVSKRTAEATLTVKDGQTIMMGGFITEHKSKSRSGVPLLKDIPLLGALFRSKSDSNDRSELIVLMKATVLPSPEKAAEVASQEKMMLPGIRQAEQQFLENEERLLKKTKGPKSSKPLKSPNDAGK